MRRPPFLARLALAACLLAGLAGAQKQPAPLERALAKNLQTLADEWFKARPPTRFADWNQETRAALEKKARALGPLPEGALDTVVELLWTAAKKDAPKIEIAKGKLTLDTPYGPAWCYVASAGKHPPLLIGLHGGGEGAGSADEALGNWERKGCVGLYPQGIELVH